MKEIKNCIDEFKPKWKKDNLIISCNKLRNNHNKEELLSFRTQFVYQAKIKRSKADMIKTGIQTASIFMVIISIIITIVIQGSSQLNSGFYQITNKIDNEQNLEQIGETQKEVLSVVIEFFGYLIKYVGYSGIGVLIALIILSEIANGDSKKASYYECLVEFIDKKDNI
ncbi:hypothetical protein KPL39_02090 [Clostridium gasigenes]|uniref:hypothetical protein n=1 Tax=Clostridium gasigenes TaxID=94869 RepID=UPI001C0B4283|nr:hypothetical protein [Clostridium gasigenes]MBU3135051.1 hypothetical protein [Clostridium gasigenes]